MVFEGEEEFCQAKWNVKDFLGRGGWLWGERTVEVIGEHVLRNEAGALLRSLDFI